MSEIKGWCPGAWTPMRSGDGLILRVRPPMGHITRDQALGLCSAARGLANGIIDLTNRANLQLRGVRGEGYQPLLDQLLDLRLIDPDPATEKRRNIMMTPFCERGDLSWQLAEELVARLDALPPLPAKFGFAIDCGDAPVLTGDPADIRFERASDGGLLIRADGADWGRLVAPEEAVDAAIMLAYWFAQHQTPEARRMRALADRLPDVWQQEMPALVARRPEPGRRAEGFLLGVAFGSMTETALRGLLDQTGAQEVILTLADDPAARRDRGPPPRFRDRARQPVAGRPCLRRCAGLRLGHGRDPRAGAETRCPDRGQPACFGLRQGLCLPAQGGCNAGRARGRLRPCPPRRFVG
ncbi:cobalamin biosynthesis protein CobG [Seohaeicola zhoushanensis]